MQPLAADPDPDLIRIEAEISQHRAMYLRAVWAGNPGDALDHEAEVDRLIGEWDQVHRRNIRPRAET